MNIQKPTSNQIQINISKDKEIETLSNVEFQTDSNISSIINNNNNTSNSKSSYNNNNNLSLNNYNLDESVNIEKINIKKSRQPSLNYISRIRKDTHNLKNILSDSLKSDFLSIEDDYSDSSSFSMSSSSLNSSMKNNNTSILSTRIKAQKPKEIYNKIMLAEQECDNDYETNEMFRKLKLSEYTTSFFTSVTIIVGLVYHDINTNIKREKIPNSQINKFFINFNLIIISVSVICFIYSSVLSYLIQIELLKSMNKITKRTTFFNFKYFSSFLLETFFSLFHPNIFTKNIIIHTKKNWYKVECEYELNDFLTFISLFRFYVIFRCFIFLTSFYTLRANRISRLIGTELTRAFALRCFIAENPFTFLLATSLFIILIAFMLKITEGPYYTAEMGINDYRKIKNCIWNVFVTITTVGYGDMYPNTLLGKIIIILASLGGVFIVSLVTIAIQNTLNMSKSEENSFNLRFDEIINEKIKKKAGLFFISSMKYYIARKKYKNFRITNKNEKKDAEYKNKLKKDIENCLYKKIIREKKFKKFTQFCKNTYQAITENEMLNEKIDEFQDDLNEINDTNQEIKNKIDGLYNEIFNNH
jgi:hypothetical protein